jgi:hypothetical protein
MMENRNPMDGPKKAANYCKDVAQEAVDERRILIEQMKDINKFLPVSVVFALLVAILTGMLAYVFREEWVLVPISLAAMAVWNLYGAYDMAKDVIEFRRMINRNTRRMQEWESIRDRFSRDRAEMQ